MVELQLVLVPQLRQPHLLLLHYFFPNRANYQHIDFAHQVYIAAATALTRVFPVLFGDGPEQDLNAYKNHLMAIGQLSNIVDEHGQHLVSRRSQR